MNFNERSCLIKKKKIINYNYYNHKYQLLYTIKFEITIS